MGKTKSAVVRYQALDRCFRNPGRKYYIKDLLEACNEAILDLDPEASGVKIRQLYDDIKFMRDSRGYEAPIDSFKEGRKTYYRYTDISFTINKQPLNEMEARQLKESLATLSRFKGLPQFEWVEEMKLRLEDSFNLKSEEQVISFEENPFLTGLDLIGDLYNAIVNKQVLTIEYRSFKSTQNQVVGIHPYHLKQFNNRWFLFGMNESYGSLLNLALDRIKGVHESNLPFKENTKYDFDEYFDDVVGVSVYEEDEIQKILIKVDAVLWPYLDTKPVHGSQRIKEKGGDHVLVQLDLIPNYEFYALMLSYGAGIEIVEPGEVRSRINEIILQMWKKYNCAD